MKSLDGLLPGNRSSTLDEWLAPVVAVAVATLIHECLELPVRDLESIDPEVVDVANRVEPYIIAPAHHAHHAGRQAVHRVQPIPIESARRRRTLDRLKAILGYTQPENRAWNADAFERRPAERKPARRSPIRCEGDVGSRGFGSHRNRKGDVQQELSQLWVVGNEIQRLSRQQ